MGAALSSIFVPDTSKVVLSPADRASNMLLAITWVLVLYACAMIFSTCTFVDRWRGPTDKIRVGPGRVFGALLLPTAWPMVMLYLVFAN